MRVFTKLKIALLGALLTCAACVVAVPPIKPPTPPPPTFCIAPSVTTTSGAPLVGALVNIGAVSGVTNQDGYLYLLGVPAGHNVLTVSHDGYVPYLGDYNATSWMCDYAVTLPLKVAPLPAVPTRTQVISVHNSFNSLTVNLSTGSIPWFDAALSSLSAADRQVVYAAKHANGDTHAIINFAPGVALYPEPNQPYQNYQIPDYENNPGAFVAMVTEVIQNGFIPEIHILEDNEVNSARRLGIAIADLKAAPTDLNSYVLFNPGFDGIFYGWPPADIDAFGKLFRQLSPNGYLSIEFNAGHIPVGNGPADYAPGGIMQNYDALLAEFDLWPLTGDGEWQILGRLLGPGYHRPADQPATDDPRPPYYLASPTPRGPMGVVCFEWGTYRLVRSQLTPAMIAQAIAYYLGMGCEWAK